MNMSSRSLKNGHFAYLSPFGGLGAQYAVHFMVIGKPIVDFLYVLTAN